MHINVLMMMHCLEETLKTFFVLFSFLQPWKNFEDAINKEFSDDLKRGGTPLLKFLAYVLNVDYGESFNFRQIIIF